MNASLERGAVVLVRFDPSVGSEIRKTRPAVVVSNNAACRYDAVVQVVPATRLPERELRPYECRVSPEASGLSKPSRLVANQVRTVSKERIASVLGKVSSAEQEALDRALIIQLALDGSRCTDPRRHGAPDDGC